VSPSRVDEDGRDGPAADRSAQATDGTKCAVGTLGEEIPPFGSGKAEAGGALLERGAGCCDHSTGHSEPIQPLR
jgi:hypothetical protein